MCTKMNVFWSHTTAEIYIVIHWKSCIDVIFLYTLYIVYINTITKKTLVTVKFKSISKSVFLNPGPGRPPTLHIPYLTPISGPGFSQYQVHKVRTCVLGSSDFGRTNSANGTAAYLITSVSSPLVIYTVLQYNEIYNTLPLFVFM